LVWTGGSSLRRRVLAAGASPALAQEKITLLAKAFRPVTVIHELVPSPFMRTGDQGDQRPVIVSSTRRYICKAKDWTG